jgi:hypothetical protein
MRIANCNLQIAGRELPGRGQWTVIAHEGSYAKAQRRKGAKRNLKSQISDFKSQVSSLGSQIESIPRQRLAYPIAIYLLCAFAPLRENSRSWAHIAFGPIVTTGRPGRGQRHAGGRGTEQRVGDGQVFGESACGKCGGGGNCKMRIANCKLQIGGRELPGRGQWTVIAHEGSHAKAQRREKKSQISNFRFQISSLESRVSN